MDGNVRRVDALSNAPTTHDMPTADFGGYYSENGAAPDGNWAGDEYIQSISDVEDATNDETTVLLWDDLTTNDAGAPARFNISVVGSTLQVENATTGQHMAFAVTSDANTVLIQDSITGQRPDHLHGRHLRVHWRQLRPGARGAHLNDDEAGYFQGYIGAVFENGIATSVCDLRHDRDPH